MDETFAYGRLDEKSLTEIFNDAPAKQIRATLLQDRPFDACRNCYYLEKIGKRSLRQDGLADYSDSLKLLAETEQDGSLESSALLYLNLRFSNVCNFKCRSCGPDSSTSWQAELKSHGFPLQAKSVRVAADVPNFWGSFDPHWKSLKHVYFAGGEPLLHDDHYSFLERLLENGRPDVSLSYNTNFSNLSFKGRSALAYWNRFKNVKISASFDGVGAHGELLRKGMDWQQTLHHFRLLRVMAPHVEFEVFPTVSVMNVFHITAALDEWIRVGMIRDKKHIQFNILNLPRHLNLNILNSEERDDLARHYREYLIRLKSSVGGELYGVIERELESVLRYFSPEIWHDERRRFRGMTDFLDHARGEKFLRLFPEHLGLFCGD